MYIQKSNCLQNVGYITMKNIEKWILQKYINKDIYLSDDMDYRKAPQDAYYFHIFSRITHCTLYPFLTLKDTSNAEGGKRK